MAIPCGPVISASTSEAALPQNEHFLIGIFVSNMFYLFKVSG
jgi:hypothetical protein